MGNTAQYSFEGLRSDDGFSSLAYWLCLAAPSTKDAETFEGLLSLMSRQYDLEEQADCFGYALPYSESWIRDFRPLAPVQLTDSWSPIPYAIQWLGEPSVAEIYPGVMNSGAVVVWEHAVLTSEVPPPESGNMDGDRFRRLVQIAAQRAGENRDLLLVAKPGWSHERIHELSEETKQLMEEAMFAVVTRRAEPT